MNREAIEDWALGIPQGVGGLYAHRDTPLGYVLGSDCVWLNADRGRLQHVQEYVRASVNVCAGSATVILVPLAALDAAQADYRTILPVDVHRERWNVIPRCEDVPPGDMRAMPDGRIELWKGARWIVARGSAGDRDIVGAVVRDDGQFFVRLIDGQYHWHDARHWLGDSVFTAEREGVRQYFLSSFDRQEVNPLYFLSQLPSPAATVDEAIELLAPESVKTARDMGRTVIRQGDMFAIPVETDTPELLRQGALIVKRRVEVRPRVVEATPLYGTAHTASEVATMPNGLQYARGCLYHDPAVLGEKRPADHARRKLGRFWHLIARNTVPVLTGSPNNDTTGRALRRGEL